MEADRRSSFDSSEFAEYVYPRAQVGVLAVMLFANALNVTILFPFLGFFVEDLGLTHDREEVGFYAGWIGSAFMIGRTMTSFCWGGWSDTHGRKPVLVVGLVSIVVTSVSMGLASSFAWAVATRAVAGLFNGIVGTAKACASEMAAPEHQGRAMVWITVSWGLGLIVGPALGGLLARPTEQYPTWFDVDGLFGEYPYLLPNLTATVMGVLALIASCWFDETLGLVNGRRRKSVSGGIEMGSRRNGSKSARAAPSYSRLTADAEDDGDSSNGGFDAIDVTGATESSGVRPDSYEGGGDEEDSADRDASSDKLPLRGVDAAEETPLYKQKVVMQVMVLYSVWSMVQICLTEVVPLWAIVSEKDGGLALESGQLGTILALGGALMSVFQIIVFPRVEKRLGPLALAKLAMGVSIVAVCLIPLTHAVVLSGAHWVTVWAFFIGTLFVKDSLALVAFTSIFMLISNSVKPNRRGAAQGLSMTVGSIGKSIGPAAGGTIFAWSVTAGHLPFPFDFSLTFIVCAGFCGTCLWLTCVLPRSLNKPL